MPDAGPMAGDDVPPGQQVNIVTFARSYGSTADEFGSGLILSGPADAPTGVLIAGTGRLKDSYDEGGLLIQTDSQGEMMEVMDRGSQTSPFLSDTYWAIDVRSDGAIFASSKIPGGGI